MIQALAVATGGALGAMMRHFSVVFAVRLWGDGFPYGTLAVNVLGSFIIGVLLEAMALKWQVSQEMRGFLVTGILGGFTTFSAFSFDFFKLAETHQAVAAGVYLTASVGLSLAAVFAGVFLMRGVLS